MAMHARGGAIVDKLADHVVIAIGGVDSRGRATTATRRRGRNVLVGGDRNLTVRRSRLARPDEVAGGVGFTLSLAACWTNDQTYLIYSHDGSPMTPISGLR